MPKLKIPASYTARRRIVLNGTVYTPGQTIPNATVKALRNLSSLLSHRWIVPNIDPYGRRTKLKNPQPTDIGAVARKSL